MAESLTRMINEQTEDLTAYAHHGSLSREIRSSVEEKMKRGELRAIIATSSLELGIDIGTLDEVILAGTPVSQASLIQRIGRSGHFRRRCQPGAAAAPEPDGPDLCSLRRPFCQGQ